MNLTVSEWFGHGLLDYPPLEGDYLDLVSGGSIIGMSERFPRHTRAAQTRTRKEERARWGGSLAETSAQVNSLVIANRRFMATTTPGTSSESTHATYVACLLCSFSHLLHCSASYRT
jgi:hypothetical protein